MTTVGFLGTVHRESGGDLRKALEYCRACRGAIARRAIKALQHAAHVWRTAHKGDGIDPMRNLRWGIVRGRVACAEINDSHHSEAA